MIIPSSRFDYRGSKRRSRRKLFITVIVTIIVGCLIGIGIWKRREISRLIAADAADANTLFELWHAAEYDELISQAEAMLEADPLDAGALMYRGFAHFYLSTESFSLEEKLPHIDASIASLRKALLQRNAPFQGGVEYVLGKAYHYKGRYYADLAISYLERSLENGYVGNDTYEYLGLAYSNLGYYEKSAENFKKAIDIDATDMRYLALSQAYINANRISDAESYLLRTINKTEDPLVEQRSRFLLGRIFFDSDQLPKAQDQYQIILDENPRSADAFYYLGEIFLRYDKPIEARAYWRRALDVDPSHYGAKLRYYK